MKMSKTTMIERVARSIFETWAAEQKSKTTWEELLRMRDADGYQNAKGVYRLAIKEARAAIESMREPMNEMTVVGREEADKRDAVLGNGEIAIIWRAMISAALSRGDAE